MKPSNHAQSPALQRPDHAGAAASAGTPFDLGEGRAYENWRSEKLNFFSLSPEALAKTLMVPVADPASPRPDEKGAIFERCDAFNMAIYATSPDTEKQDVLALARHLGLQRFDTPLCTGEDGLTEITVADGGREEFYIPYTDKPLSWHTDGYYNKPDEQVRGFLLHCRRPAREGGLSELLDPDVVYIRLRDENPDFIRVLMEDDVLTIPANMENGVVVRDAATGPVFSVIAGKLHMRYTDRKRHIEWKDDATVLAARQKLTAVLNDAEECIVRFRLEPGQGVVCNNVLHRRTGFSNDPDAGSNSGENSGGGRLLYRARFLDRVGAHQ